jgi:hypothetical protein
MATQWDTMHSSRRAELEAQGVPPHIAMEQAAMETLRARQAQVAATIPRDADGRPSLDDDEAAFDASMADAMGQSNLAAAATPLEMEPEVGGDETWHQWVDEAPGSERQARYNPEGYAMYRESVRDGIREQAQDDLAEYGDGNMDQLKGRIEAGDPDAVRFYDNRMRRNAAEDRVIRSPWQESRRRVRLEEASGVPAEQLADMDTDALRAEGYRQRMRGKAERQGLVAQRAKERQNPMSQMNDEWRQYVLASQVLGRPAGASPSDVQARNLDAAFRLAQTQNLGGRGNETADLLADRRETAADERMRAGRTAASAVLSYHDKNPERRRAAAARLLVNAGYSAAEIQLILDDVFGSVPQEPEPPPATPGYPGGVGDMGQGFSM